MTAAPSPWTTLDSREIYRNRWMRVREDQVVRPDGEPGIYGVVEVAHPAVFIVAVTDNDEVVMIELYRYTTGTWSLEIPAGSTDGEDALLAAQRELAEETGLAAASWRDLGAMSSLNGLCDAPERVFLATGLTEAADSAHSQAEEGIAEVRRVPWREVWARIADGTITDAETLAALMRAAVSLGLVGRSS